MPKFSQASFSKLATCHEDLQKLFFEVIKTFDCQIIEGHRGQQAQDEAFRKGFSQKKWPNGNHNSQPSLAVDVMPYPVDYKATKDIIYFAGYVMGIAARLKEEGKITHTIRWGGDWDKDKRKIAAGFFDGAHFEIVL